MLGACSIVDLPVEGVDAPPFILIRRYTCNSNFDYFVIIIIYSFLYTVFDYY
jgi:hypothetical protein